jgi:hypothetical protein
VLDKVHVRDGHVVEAAYKEQFDLFFSVPKFEYDDVVGREGERRGATEAGGTDELGRGGRTLAWAEMAGLRSWPRR